MIEINKRYITNDNGQTTDIFIPKQDYEKLVEYIEDLEDITACEEVKADTDQSTISWEDIKRS
jgi:CO dehydrogenase/acetyl-CoA synthase beta subunit